MRIGFLFLFLFLSLVCWADEGGQVAEICLMQQLEALPVGSLVDLIWFADGIVPPFLT